MGKLAKKILYFLKKFEKYENVVFFMKKKFNNLKRFLL